MFLRKFAFILIFLTAFFSTTQVNALVQTSFQPNLSTLATIESMYQGWKYESLTTFYLSNGKQIKEPTIQFFRSGQAVENKGEAIKGYIQSSPNHLFTIQETTVQNIYYEKAPISDLVLALNEDFPDPSALFYQGIYYAYATADNRSATRKNSSILVSTSIDNEHYSTAKSAIAKLPSWIDATRGFWAPEVVFLNGKFVMYFSPIDKKTGLRVLAVATSKFPDHGFVVENNPLLSDVDKQGYIDASVFTDNNGKNYLLFKNEGNQQGKSSSIWIQPLSADGLKITGKKQKLLESTQIPNPPNNDNKIMVPLIENPYLIQKDGVYTLFFSAGNWMSKNYFTGYAQTTSLDKPFTYKGPLVTTASMGGEGYGVGGLSAGKDLNGFYLLFHGWTSPSETSYEQFGKRVLFRAHLDW
ncbi:MAG: glycoside hydrolase family 43 protein [Streptococcaceae bacterium]|jgi:alpha-N-arabinofuranosidase|nr:glycoside hydrolase family 43 protein [Streptococcaceae bacterium]